MKIISNDTGNKSPILSPTLSKLYMLISGICMGSIGVFLRYLEGRGYPVYSIIFFRGIFGTILLSIIMYKSHSFKKELFKESFHFHWKNLVLSNLFYALMVISYFITISFLGYSIPAFLLYTSGIFLLLLLIITKEEKVSKISMLSFILAILGVGCIMEFWNGGMVNIFILLGIFSGFSYGISIFFKKKIYNQRKRIENTLLVIGNFDLFFAWFLALFMIIIFFPFGIPYLFSITWLDLVYFILLGLIPTTIPFILYNVAVKNDKGGNIVILSYSEPIVATVYSVIISQSLSVFTIIGGALILLANIIMLKFSLNK